MKPVTQLLERPWLSLQRRSSALEVKIMTWNLLAQTLVRRDLFPTSDCLKASQRRHLLHEEIERQNADILCLQEVDTLDKLLPVLEKAGYSHRYASGPFKKHGCLIAFKKSLYSAAVAEKTIFYDDEQVSAHGTDVQKIGKSFRTKNIGLIVGLRRLDNADNGLVVATTHLFWHPRYTYERTRWASNPSWSSSGLTMPQGKPGFWRAKRPISNQPMPLAVHGRLFSQGVRTLPFLQKFLQFPISQLDLDFNFTPLDPAYSLLTTGTLNADHDGTLSPSRVVHVSIDPSISVGKLAATADGDEAGGAGGGEEKDPDRVITNARPANAEDGLLDSHSLISLFSKFPRATSLYDRGLSLYLSKQTSLESADDIPTFGRAHSLAPDTSGFHEPAYTSYTHYWKSVLDYIFVLTSDPESVQVTGLLAPLPAKLMDPGLPQKRVCGSDHLPLVASFEVKLP
ncbi:hypothetical protein NMY22_g5134 [Coprinellus aureogranulatus]|nr:hypothetical protein NMY22_g5134 [Coprinellus aureogranulatus]